MLEPRHRTPQPAGLRLGLLSVFALLAFACFPVLATADSGDVEYRDVPPSPIGGEQDKNRSNSRDTGDGPAQSGTQPGSTDDGAGGDRSGDDQPGAGGGGKDKGGKGKGSPGAKQAGETGLGAKRVAGLPASTDDGSSPLVPILIALAVLAAISIGAVAMRRKRRDADPGSPVSPEAG